MVEVKDGTGTWIFFYVLFHEGMPDASQLGSPYLGSFSYIRKFRRDQSYMRKGFLIYEETHKNLVIYWEAVLIYEIAPDPFKIS